MPATVVFREESTKPDGSRHRMVAWSVPESNEFPEGIKYSFQYMDADGNTLLRYDNASTHPDVGRHHRHTPTGEIEPLEYRGLSDLIERFHAEVNDLYDRRNG